MFSSRISRSKHSDPWSETPKLLRPPQAVILICSCLVGLLTVAPASSQEVHILDLLTTGRARTIIPDLDSAGRLGGELFFSAGHHDGRELWKSDATVGGTVPVADLLPGTEGIGPRDLTRVGDVIFFTGTTPSTGRELWWTDGTSEGTEMLVDLEGVVGSEPKALTVLGDELIFHADAAGARGLWKASSVDGTVESVRFLPPTIDEDAKIRVADDRAYFFADGGSGIEVWSSDGTTLGTAVETAIACPELSRLRSSGSDIFFVCAWPTFYEILTLDDTVVSGARGLFRTGLDEITELVHVGTPPPDGLLYFIRGGDDVWVYDLAGSAGAAVTSLGPAGDPSHLYRFDGGVVFVADSGDGRELHWTNTTTTHQIKDIHPTGGSSPDDFRRDNGVLYFTAADGTHGLEAWMTDGTEVGTTMISDMAPGTFSSYPNGFTPTAAGVFFTNYDNGLYLTDGTEIGTIRLDDVPSLSSSPRGLFPDPSSDRLFFRANLGDGWEPFVTDGTLPGTVALGDLAPDGKSSYPTFLGVIADGSVLFSADDGTDDRLYRSDGTEVGTYAISDPLVVSDAVIFDGALYFSGHDGTDDYELWRSDGTEVGTGLLVDINPTSSSSPYEMTVFGEFLYFVANGDGGGSELWRSDGTSVGTEPFLDLNIGPDGSFPEHLAVAGDSLFFVAWDGVETGLYVSDGTVAGTSRLVDYDFPFHDFIHPDGDRVFFANRDALGDAELWVSDGTVGGTQRVVDLWNGPDSSDPRVVGLVDGHLVFWADDGAAGDLAQLWASDGSPGDATLLGVFRRALTDSGALWNGDYYFLGETHEEGYELWRTDGTLEGTEVFDLVPGDGSSFPTSIVRLNERVFFAAWDPVAKVELFSLGASSIFADGFESGDLTEWAP